MSIKVIVELHTKPGLRDELHDLTNKIIAAHAVGSPGYLGATQYAAVDDPDLMIEIVEWETAEARAAHLQEAAEAYAPVMEMLDRPFKGTLIRQFD